MEKPTVMDRVRVLFADQLNLARGKYVPHSFAEKGEARFCVGTYAVTYARDIVAAPGACVLEGLPDIEAVFDPKAYRKGWEPNTHIALADIHMHGEPSGLCGRGALKRAIAKWQAKGLNPKIGLEGEAYVFQRDEKGRWVPYDTPGAFVYGTGPFTDPEGLIDEVWATAQSIGINVESFNSEYDNPQFELTLTYDDALKACDDFFLFRQMAREVLYKRGYLLSFMPKPFLDISGSGLHINLSFTDDKGDNVFADGTGKGALSDLAKGCIAGLLHHHEALGAIVAPTVNSYARLKPAGLSGYWANWGHDHRSVAVRISGETGKAARIEHRVGDCAASPYVAVAGVLNAALLGVEGGYDLQPEETGDGLENIDATRHVPDSLADALVALKADTAFTEALGQLLVDNFIAVKEAEIGELDGKNHQGIFDYYAPFI
ncbi:glutamine synthetase family protein [Kordiimonas marina]|uniref:glutamine synthetase family protein n=1 Tax=Kordiimonas marina TaxID=2872312 RepID=UPI001FF4101F|nr:glutamine synthetase family protein [Kordiimonas marina]MCJ9427962.1 glutamine synthetase family protein [Kordiimonas marina]